MYRNELRAAVVPTLAVCVLAVAACEVADPLGPAGDRLLSANAAEVTLARTAASPLEASFSKAGAHQQRELDGLDASGFLRIHPATSS